ncbi:hypothetical protein MMC06_000945 [Schaereria dolodes]|nr:hypothetical protein [Schaereria dolodes]
MTITGKITTVTVTPTAPPVPIESVQRIVTPTGFFASTGKVAGVFTLIGVLIVAATVLAIFCIRKRNKRPALAPYAATNNTPQRRPSRLSQLGLVSGGTHSTGGKSLTPLNTGGWPIENAAEKSPDDTMTPASRRTSYPMRVVDQRLEPTAVWNPLHDNGSHVSLQSFRDDQDYSRRMLRVANPDDA